MRLNALDRKTIEQNRLEEKASTMYLVRSALRAIGLAQSSATRTETHSIVKRNCFIQIKKTFWNIFMILLQPPNWKTAYVQRRVAMHTVLVEDYSVSKSDSWRIDSEQNFCTRAGFTESWLENSEKKVVAAADRALGCICRFERWNM